MSVNVADEGRVEGTNGEGPLVRTCSAARLSETRQAQGRSFDGKHDVQPLPETKHLQRRDFSQPPVLHAVLQAQHRFGANVLRTERTISSGLGVGAGDGRRVGGLSDPGGEGEDEDEEEEEWGEGARDARAEGVDKGSAEPEECPFLSVRPAQEASGGQPESPLPVKGPRSEIRDSGRSEGRPVEDFLESKARLQSLSASLFADRGTWVTTFFGSSESLLSRSQARSLSGTRVSFLHSQSPAICFTTRSESPRICRVSRGEACDKAP